MNFWQNLKQKQQKPIIALAPMADVTDAAFRRIIAKYSKYGRQDIGDGSKVNLPVHSFSEGGPDVMFTEFTSADGLFLGGYDALVKNLIYSESERPIVAQFFTARPDMMEKAAMLAVELGFDGIDINMGCPDRSVEKQGSGAALIKNPILAGELIKAAQQGVKNAIEKYKNKKIEKLEIPVSVKTRIGYNTDELETWLPQLLSAEPDAITIHARTRKEMSAVPARWLDIKRAVEIRDSLNSKTLILGNGDVKDPDEGRIRARETGCDGIMLGRAIFGNPFLFAESEKKRPENSIKDLLGIELKGNEVSVSQRLAVLVEHTKLFEKLCSHKNFAVMKKHYKAYLSGLDNTKELRMELMEAKNSGEVEKIIDEYIKSL